MTVTEQQVLASWAKFGDGRELAPGFAAALAMELSKPQPKLPLVHGHDGELVNRTIGFQVGEMWRK